MYSDSTEGRPQWQGLLSSPGYEENFRDHYLVLGEISEGGFAQVKLAIHLLTGTEVAVKVLPKIGPIFPFILSELNIMKAVQHPNVIQLFQVIETLENIYLVMEHVKGGPLLQHIPRESGMQEEKARKIFQQIACAMHYCHEKGVVHRDLKPQNILLDAGSNVKVIDFGLGCRFRAGQKLHEVCGTFPYLAPEVCRREEYDGPAADVWSLGVILYLMVTGDLPFKGTASEQEQQILHAKYKIPARLSGELQGLIGQLLTLDPTQRPTVSQIMEHPWLSQGKEYAPRDSNEPLSNLPNPTIMRAMVNMGFDLHDTWVALQKRKFNDEMATYVILQRQITQGSGCEMQLSLLHQKIRRHCSFAKRRASEPALGTTPFLPSSDHQLPEEDTQTGQKEGRRASLPAIPLFSPKTETHPLRMSHHQDPRGSLSSEGPSLGENFSTESPHDGTTAFVHDNNQGWKGVTRRMARWFLRTCCCVTAPRTGPAFQNKMALVKTGQRWHRLRNNVAPVNGDS